MQNWWKSLDKNDRALAIFLAVLGILGLNWMVYSVAEAAMGTGTSAAQSTDYIDTNLATPETTSVDGPSSLSAHDNGRTLNRVPPTATVDGVTYTGEQQIEAMTQAARDAGYDEATAQQIGRDAAALCNGNPDCLR